MFDDIYNIINNALKLNETQLIIEAFTEVKVKDKITEYITQTQLFKDKITEYITQTQLFKLGEDGRGEKLQEYTPFTKILKRDAGQPFDITTLKDTGTFYNSFRVKVNNGGEVKVIASDPNDLIGKYGENILSLSNEGIEEIKPQIIEIAKRYIRETLFL
jgi:hypothetical protein